MCCFQKILSWTISPKRLSILSHISLAALSCISFDALGLALSHDCILSKNAPFLRRGMYHLNKGSAKVCRVFPTNFPTAPIVPIMGLFFIPCNADIASTLADPLRQESKNEPAAVYS